MCLEFLVKLSAALGVVVVIRLVDDLIYGDYGDDVEDDSGPVRYVDRCTGGDCNSSGTSKSGFPRQFYF